MKKKEELKLHIPKFEELDFYQSLLSDPATMSYNAPWFPPKGCIEFPKEKWDQWYQQWINQEPYRFYAYLQRTKDKAFVGYVNFHYSKVDDWWDMGIVILARERGKGYSKQGLTLLLQRAFEVSEVYLLHNSFENTREAAYHIHKVYGFKEGDFEDGIINLFLSKEDYYKKREGK